MRRDSNEGHGRTQYREPTNSAFYEGGVLSPVETVGIEPTSAIAQVMASTSVAGALVSSRDRLAGGVARDQPPEDVPGLAVADRTG